MSALPQAPNVRRRELRTRRWVLALLTVLTAVAVVAAIQRGGAVEWLVTAVLAGVLTLALLPWLWLTASGLQAERELEQGGEDGIMSVTLQFRSRGMILFPLLLLQIREELVNESARSTSPIIHTCWSIPWLRREWSVRYTAERLTRGSYSFGAVTVTAIDPFGLCAVKHRLSVRDGFAVLPQPEGESAPLLLLSSAAASKGAGGHGGETGRRERRAGGIGPSTRPYRNGDSMRHVDWRSAAKGRELRVKTDAAEGGSGTIVVMDAAPYGSRSDDTLLDRCAGLALQALRDGRRGGGPILLQAGGHSLPAAKGDRGAMRAAALLLAKLSVSEQGGLTRQLIQLRESRGLARRDYLVFVTANWKEALLWEEAASVAAAAGCRFEFRVPFLHGVPSAAMRERMRWAQAKGYRVRWIPLAIPGSRPIMNGSMGVDSDAWAAWS